MRKNSLLGLLLCLCLSSCDSPRAFPQPSQVGVTYDATHKWLIEKENMPSGCAGIASQEGAIPVDCVMIYNIFNEFRIQYAENVDPRGLTVKMGDSLWLAQKPSKIDGRGVPVLSLDEYNGTYAQAWFSTVVTPMITWANPYAIGCETLHLIHYKLFPNQMRSLPLQGEPNRLEVYHIIHHETPDDPLKDIPHHTKCWVVAVDRYLKAQEISKERP